ncbi:metal-dependent hydrolase [Candidatus Woesearchaeota archaeon]|nr:metal-dependent hydrolase [Candidatus Woesearchaeota archaeon]
MLFFTHLLLGIVIFLLVTPLLVGNPLIALLLVLLGSILPDIDEYHSKINQWSGIFGKLISVLSKHRGIFHSLMGAMLVGLLLGYLWSWNYALALLLGYLSHLIGDLLTPFGIALLYPFSKFKLHGPVKTGGILEWTVRTALIVIILVLLVK